MDTNSLTKNQLEALLLFLKDNINIKNLSKYQNYTIKYLFFAFLKLQKEGDEWQEAMNYTE